MTNSAIFSQAHKEAKQLGSAFGQYAVRFSFCLKQIYNVIKAIILKGMEVLKGFKLYIPYADKKEQKRVKSYLNYKWLPSEKCWFVDNTLEEIKECNLHGYLEGGEYASKPTTQNKAESSTYENDFNKYGFDFAEEGNHTGI